MQEEEETANDEVATSAGETNVHTSALPNSPSEAGETTTKRSTADVWGDAEVMLKRDLGMVHGMCFQFYTNQTIWGAEALQPAADAGRLRAHLLLVSGSDGDVHVACLRDVPGRVQSLDADEPQGNGSILPHENADKESEEKQSLIAKLKLKLEPVFRSEGVLWGDAVSLLEGLSVDELKTGVETGDVGSIMMKLVELEAAEDNANMVSPSAVWSREWVFTARIPGAGGLDNDVEIGHPRLQVCPVDGSLLALCSGLSVEIWVNEGQSVNPEESQVLKLHHDDASSEEEEMDYSLDTPSAARRAIDRKRTFVSWQLRADIREHRDVVRAVAWRLDGRLLASADSAGQIKFWARGWDSGVQRLQKFSMGAGGWCCYQTLSISVNILERVPEEAADFSRQPSDGVRLDPSSPTGR